MSMNNKDQRVMFLANPSLESFLLLYLSPSRMGQEQYKLEQVLSSLYKMINSIVRIP